MNKTVNYPASNTAMQTASADAQTVDRRLAPHLLAVRRCVTLHGLGWRAPSNLIRLMAALALMLVISACTAQQATQETLRVTVEVDGKQIPLQVPVGTTSQAALAQAGISLNNLDRVEPPSFTILAGGDVVRVTRIREVFTIQENEIPFERQTVHNESLPEGQTLMVQHGVNGSEQVTYRQVFENDVEVSNEVFKTETLVEPLPEILMIGVQKPFTPINIPGKLAYLAGGNAWLMEGSTRDRRPVVTTGDLDGRVFSISPKGDWLLFTRVEETLTSTGDEADSLPPINTLWAINLTAENPRPVNLKVQNVLHAAWVPGKGTTISYSSAEPRQTAPGWQANNDLQMITFASTGATVKSETLLDTNDGGLYGWWGTSFAWSADGSLVAYSRPDSVGLVNQERQELAPLVSILPFQTGSDWAWAPGIDWSPDGRVLYLATHAVKAGLENAESSPWFDLSALPLPAADQDGGIEAVAENSGPLINLVPQAGIFAYPVISPQQGEQGYQVAYLHAIFPEQSDSQRYRLALMDRDGSNRTILFPSDDRQGLKPQQVAWSPERMTNGRYWVAVNYQDNLWLVDTETGEAQPVTGDGLITHFDWK